jgi:hypothetical protein
VTAYSPLTFRSGNTTTQSRRSSELSHADLPSLFLADELKIEDSARSGTERGHLVVLRFEGQVSKMASCTRCENKFFTPTALAHDAIRAERYLFHKFHLHRCSE